MRTKLYAATLAALSWFAGLVDVAVAQQPRTHRIERVPNQRLLGTSYARLPGLTYAQCEARCLSDRRCTALEHIHASGNTRTTCRLFETTRGTRESAQADVGWKRPLTAAAPAPSLSEGSGKKKTAKKSAARRAQDPDENQKSAAERTTATQQPEARDQLAIAERQRAAEEAQRAAEAAARERQVELERLARERAEQERQRSAAARERPAGETQMRRFEMRRETPPPSGAAPGSAPPPSQPAYRNGGSGTAMAPPPMASAPAPVTMPPVMPAEPRMIGKETGPPAAANGSAPRTRSAAPLPPTTAPTPPPAAAAPGAAAPQPPAAGGVPPPPVGADTGTSDWDVVPVFYGTDRTRKDRDQPKRIAYSSDRARRLELGRALVTVPKAHQVPNVERPWAITVPFTNITIYQEAEDPKRHFTIREIRDLSRTDTIALVRERLAKSSSYKDHALVFVHGYSNGFDDALYRTAQIAYDLKFDGAPFLYSWPSGGGIFGYQYDSNSANQARPFMSEFLQFVLDDTGAKSVSIIAHSMGNQLLLEVLRDLKRKHPDSPRINQVILAAPDVDRDTFETMASDIRGVGRGITMYASSNDKALVASRRYAGAPRAGDVPDGLGPFVTAGIDTIDVSALSTEYLALNHSTYAERTALLRDIELIVRTGMRPPELRLPKVLLPVTAGTGIFWRYTN